MNGPGFSPPTPPLIKLEWLYYFVVLVESGSFSQAARHLYLSQQALSKIFANLEQLLQKQLLLRHPWRLTPAGEELLWEAKMLLQRVYQLEHRFAEPVVIELAGSLSLAQPAYAHPKLWKPCQQLLQQHPQLQLKFNIFQAADLIETLLLQSQVDLALLSYPPSHPQLSHKLFSSCPLRVITAPNCSEPWYQLPYVTYQETGLGWPWPEAYQRHVVAEADFTHALNLTLAGCTALWAPEDAVREPLQQGLLQVVADLPFERTLTMYLVWLAERSHETLLSPFVKTYNQTVFCREASRV